MRPFFSTIGMLIMMYGLTGCTASQVDCPPANQTFIVHKNPEREFPVYVTETRTEINTTLDALEQLRLAQLEESTIQELTQLQNTLATISADFESTSKPAYLSYHQNPCEANVDYFKIMNEITRIRELGNEFNRMLENEQQQDEGRILEVINAYRESSKTDGIQSL